VVLFVAQVLITAVAVWVSTTLPGIDITAGSTSARIGTLLGVALLFGLVNATIKPVVKLLGCLFYLVTLGLIGLVVNGLLFWFTAWLADELRLPFRVSGFWAGFWGALVVSVVSFILSVVTGTRSAAKRATQHRRA
jgi:putative membrane protein